RVHRAHDPESGVDRVRCRRARSARRRPERIRTHPLRLDARGATAAVELRRAVSLPGATHRAAGAVLRPERKAGGAPGALTDDGRTTADAPPARSSPQIQFSHRSPDTRPKCFALLVTKTTFSATACAAIIASNPPMGVPRAVRSAAR